MTMIWYNNLRIFPWPCQLPVPEVMYNISEKVLKSCTVSHNYFEELDNMWYFPSSGSPMWDTVYHQCSSCRWVKRQPRINLLYKYLLSLYRIYERTSAWRFAGCWLKKVSLLLGSLYECLHLGVCVDNNNLLYTYQLALSSCVLND
jgi:hypothetical protein